LEEEGIPIDLIAGSSMGAVVAAAYAEGRPARRLYHDMRHHWGRMGHFLFDILDYNFPRTNLLRGRKIRRMIEVAMKEKTIQECQVPLAIVCTDLITGREVVLEEGPLGDATFASGALPGIFRPIRWGEHLLVDGAVLNKVPVRVLQRKGARVILAVNVTPDREMGMDLANGHVGSVFSRVLNRIPPFNRWRNIPNILRIISRSLSVSGLNQSRVHSDIIDVEIKPRVDQFDFLRFDQFDALVEAGAEAAREAIPSIRRILKEGV
jgi:NTE family protein